MDEGVDRLKEHLDREIGDRERKYTFDMNDEREKDVLACSIELQEAVDTLERTVGTAWERADKAALRSQKWHRILSRAAIVSGTAAIVFAILQLATKLTYTRALPIPRWLELIAAVCAFFAVIIGLAAKHGHHWLDQRHLAERYRMLKFRALQQLCCMDKATWENWIETQMAGLAGRIDSDAWSRRENVEEPALGTPTNHEPGFAPALATFYLAKRLHYQANYFEERAKAFEQQVEPWKKAPPWFFFVGIGFVLLHVGMELLIHYDEGYASLEPIADWLVAFAAITPVIGVGVRTWHAAFEVPRSASLFAAKHEAVKGAMQNVERDRRDVALTQAHIAQNERFLENEHREWLRLLREAEWFL